MENVPGGKWLTDGGRRWVSDPGGECRPCFFLAVVVCRELVRQAVDLDVISISERNAEPLYPLNEFGTS